MPTAPPDRHRLYELLEQYRTELMAFSADELVRPQVSRERAFELTGILLPHIRALDGTIGRELHPTRADERRRQMATLEERILVFYAADLEAEKTFANTTRQRRMELARIVKKHDRTLLNWAVALFSDDSTLARELEDIRRGTGQRDDAEDTLRLVSMFRDRLTDVSENTSLTREQLDRAAEDAAELLDLLRPGHLDPARDLARRAYLAWQRDYWELQTLGRYLERADPAGAARRFPGIHSSTSSANATPADDDDSSPDDSNPPESDGAGDPSADPGTGTPGE